MKTMIVTDKMKRNTGILCCIPFVMFFSTLAYYLALAAPTAVGHHIPGSLETVTEHHYDTLFMLLALCAVVAASVLIFCVVHLVRIVQINTQTKMIWILLLVSTVPFSFILFWYFLIRKEPKVMAIGEV